MELGWVTTNAPPVAAGQPLCICAQSLWLWNRMPLRIVYRKEGRSKLSKAAGPATELVAMSPRRMTGEAPLRFRAGGLTALDGLILCRVASSVLTSMPRSATHQSTLKQGGLRAACGMQPAGGSVLPAPRFMATSLPARSASALSGIRTTTLYGAHLSIRLLDEEDPRNLAARHGLSEGWLVRRYEIYTVSRPATPLAWLTYPVVRLHQQKFARCSMKAVRQALHPCQPSAGFASSADVT